MQPGLLRRAEQRARGVPPGAVAEGGEARGDVASAGHGRGEVELAHPSADARLGQGDGGERAYLIAAPWFASAAFRTRRQPVADRHPFAIGTRRRSLAQRPVALVRLVVLRAVHPGIVGELMIVPLRDHRHDLVQPLERGVGAIAGIAQAIVGEHDGLARRQIIAAGNRRAPRRILARRIFVDIVAQMHGEVDVVARGGVGIGVEPAEAEVGAGKDGEAETRDLAHRQGAGATRAAHRPVWRDEAIEIPAIGTEPVDGDLGGVIGLRARGDAAAAEDAGEVAAVGQFDGQSRLAARADIAGPQQDRGCAGLPAGDAMGEAAAGQRLRGSGQGERADAQRAEAKQQAAVRAPRRRHRHFRELSVTES